MNGEVSGASDRASKTRIKPFLTTLAAAGFVVIMVLASALHLSIGERPIAQLLICGLAAFVVWGRFRKAPIASRRGELA
jgi:hypothetical protein